MVYRLSTKKESNLIRTGKIKGEFIKLPAGYMIPVKQSKKSSGRKLKGNWTCDWQNCKECFHTGKTKRCIKCSPSKSGGSKYEKL